MASPFQVGYVQEYAYPGSKFKKTPRGGRPPIDPREYNPLSQQISQYLDGMYREATSLPPSPSWIRDRLTEDFERTLKGNATPEGDFSTEQSEQFGGDAAEAGIQGAFGIEFNINPKDWVEDPKKTATKMLQQWKKRGINMEDLESRQYTALWQKVTGGLEDDTFAQNGHGILGKINEVTQKGAAHELEARHMRQAMGISREQLFEGGVVEKGKGPLWLKGLDVYKEDKRISSVLGTDDAGNIIDVKTQKKDVYNTYRINLIDAKRVMGSPGDRDSAYQKSIGSFADAISTDVRNQILAEGGPVGSTPYNWDAFFANNTKIDSLHPNVAVRQGMKNQAKTTVKAFELRSELSQAIVDAEGKFSGAAVTNDLNRIMELGIGEKDSKGVYENLATLKRDHAKHLKHLEAIETQMDTIIDLYSADSGHPKKITFKRWNNGVEETITESFNAGDVAARKRFESIQKQWKESADAVRALDMDKLIKTLETANPVEARIAVANYMGKYASAKGGDLHRAPLIKGNATRRSIVLQLNMQLEAEVLGGGKDKDLKSMGSVIGLMNQDKAFRMRRLQVGQVDLFNERIEGTAMELLKNIEGGRMNTYVWERVRTRVRGFTPAYYSDLFLKKTHYFGLSFDTSPNPVKGYKWADKLFKTGLSEHRIGVNLGTIGGVKKSIKLLGGEDLAIAAELYNGLRKNDYNREVLKALLSADLNKVSKDDLMKQLAILNGKPGAPKAVTMSWADDFDELKTKLGKLKGNVKGKLSKVGLAGHEDNGETMTRLVEGLGKYNNSFDTYKIKYTHLGGIQKLAVKFNQMQTWILSKFGKVLGPLLNLKIIVKEAITNFIMGAIGFASGGTLSLPAYALRVAISATVGKVLDLGTTFVKGVFKFDMSEFMKELEKTGKTLYRVSMYIVMIPCGCLMLVIVGVIGVGAIMGGSTTSVNSVELDPDLGRVDISVVPGGGVPPGDITVSGECPIPGGSISCGSFVTPSAGGCGHGLDSYWTGGNVRCSYTIPYLGGSAAGKGMCPGPGSGDACGYSDAGSRGNTKCICANFSVACPATDAYYGLAADIINSGTLLPGQEARTVYLPVVEGVSNWEITGTFSIFKGTRGYGAIVVGEEGGKRVEMYFAHLTEFFLGSTGQPTTGVAGQPLARLYNFGTASEFHGHLHLEVRVNGTFRDPVSLCP